jgi:lysophospholipase L1-like esterase
VLANFVQGLIMGRLKTIILVLLSNAVLTLVLLGLLELGHRIYRDGFSQAFANIVSHFGVPYSNLGTSNWVIYDDELGYRLNPDRPNINRLSVRHGEIAIPKPPGRYRVIVLGDSVPWDRNGFVSHLREELNGRGNYEVINASVPGYTTYQELVFFKRYLLQTDPDLVIWNYCLNDNHKFLHQFNEKGRMLTTREAMESLEINSTWDFLVSRSYVLSSLRVRFIAARQQGADKNRSKFVWENQSDFNIAWKDHSWPSYEGHLREMINLLRNGKTKLAIVIFPFEPQLTHRHDVANREYVTKPQRLLNVLCQKYRVPCLDLYPEFSASYDQGQRLYRDGIHLNDPGHRLTTSILDDFLLRNKLLPAG